MMMRILQVLLLTSCTASVAANVTAEPDQPVTLFDRVAACNVDPRVTLGMVTSDVCVGADLFFREPFGGNGRTCATCHPALHNFTIDPAFIATLPTTDPLFVAETNQALSGLERPTLMRQFGLILENLDGAEDPTNKFVMRAVPHTFALSTAVTAELSPTDGTTRPPNERTGWSGDGAPGLGELRDFQTGAIFQHYTKSLSRVSGVDFTPATPAELDAIVAFMRTIGRTTDLSLTSVSLTDASAEIGRLTFMDPIKRCNGCHNNASAHNAAGINRNFNTGVEAARIPTLDTMGIPHDGGFGSSPSVFGFGTGSFNTPPLIEAADTGPWFHTNAFGPQIEDAIAFYASPAFAASPSGNGNPIPLSLIDIFNLGRFLRVLNASMNGQLAAFRITALIQLIDNQKNHNRDMQQDLARLALAEVTDAVAVLSTPSPLNPDARAEFVTAQTSLICASTNASPVHRLECAQDALAAVTAANAAMGTGMTMTMGQGSLMF